MAVYVDDAKNPYGRMLMCHMVADSTSELVDMAEQIGLALKWIQNPGTPKEHFDVCQTRRTLAIIHGAIPITSRELVNRGSK
jgi:hypothetical protein